PVLAGRDRHRDRRDRLGHFRGRQDDRAHVRPCACPQRRDDHPHLLGGAYLGLGPELAGGLSALLVSRCHARRAAPCRSAPPPRTTSLTRKARTIPCSPACTAPTRPPGRTSCPAV